jgi:type I restriction enzyme R subunit
MYGIELAYLVGKTYNRARNDLKKKVSALSAIANIPQIMVQSSLISEILQTEYLEMAGINEFEHIRKSLRDLIKFIPKRKIVYTTDFADDILSVEWKDSELDSDVLKNYKAKAEFYVRQHQENAVISKLKTNQPLSSEDLNELENILWSELGSKEEYELAYGQKPLGEFVREIIGLDMKTAKELFAEYLNETKFDSKQIYFVNQVIEYIVRNGIMKDLSVLQETPFTDYGSIVDLFKDVNVWFGIRGIIEQINANAVA